MVEVEQRLLSNRLVTLTGPAGSGKSRLALEVAYRLAPSIVEGAWLVELAPLAQPELLPVTIARALGLKDSGGTDPADLLAEHLASRRLLLVIDNCEHLVEACRDLAQALLDAAPGLAILATSQQSLGLPGEVVWKVPALSLPPAKSPPNVDAAATEAVQLFRLRAQAVDQGFELDTDTLPPVVEICRRLDGLPLAIELAAARLNLLSVDQLNDRLGDRLAILAGKRSGTAPRQASLRAAFEWSHDLLSEREQVVFARLAVFSAGWRLEAAEDVVAGGSIQPGEVLEILSGLADKSLLERVGSGPEARQRMLESVSLFGLERLRERGEEAETRLRHAHHFLSAAEEAEPNLAGHDQSTWLNRLESDHDNIRGALDTFLRQAEVDLALRLASALRRFWWVHGHLSEGQAWLTQALDRGADAPPELVAKALSTSGTLAYHQGHLALADSRHRAALVVWRRLDALPDIADSLNTLGLAAWERSDFAAAEGLLTESLEIARRLDDRWRIARMLGNLGILAEVQGNYAAAGKLEEESLALWRETGDQRGVATTLNNLSVVARGLGNLARAVAQGRESLAVFEELADPLGIALAALNLGRAHALMGQDARAAELYRRSLDLRRRAGFTRGIAECFEALAAEVAAQRRHETAICLLAVAARLRAEIGVDIQEINRRERDRILAEARSALGVSGFRSTWDRGTSATIEEVTREAEPPAQPPRRRSNSDRAALTRREEEVAGLVAAGLSNQEISDRTGISRRTVETHVANVLDKLGFKSRSQIAAWRSDRG